MLEGLIPSLGTVVPAYPRDLSLKGGLGLDHSQVVGLLLGALSLHPGEHRLFLGVQSFVPGPLYNVFGPLCLGQFLLLVDDLLLGNLQLVLSL